MSVGIFIYGAVVFAIVCAALGLIGWGILTERRDRTSYEQARRVFGEPAAAFEASRDGEAAAR
jgi:hypothetical protein